MPKSKCQFTPVRTVPPRLIVIVGEYKGCASVSRPGAPAKEPAKAAKKDGYLSARARLDERFLGGEGLIELLELRTPGKGIPYIRFRPVQLLLPERRGFFPRARNPSPGGRPISDLRAK